MQKVGIVYCPNHRPFCSVAKRRKKIMVMLDKYGIEYDMVQSEERQSVERLVTMLLNNGYTTIVIAGGDGALNDAANCLMRLEKHVRDKVTLGVIPNGIMNDFALFWGFTYRNVEGSVASIAERRVRSIDLGCIRYKDKRGNSRQRYFLDCLNIGLLATIHKLKHSVRRKLWSRKLTFAASMLLMVFLKKEYKIKYTINELTEQHRVTTLCIGSASGYGQTPNATPYNGMLDVMVMRSSFLLQYVEAIYLFLCGKLLNHKRVTPYRTQQVVIYSGSRLPVSVDGHAMESPEGEFVVDIEKEVVNFIVEKI